MSLGALPSKRTLIAFLKNPEHLSGVFLVLAVAMLPLRLGGTLLSPTIKPSEVLAAISLAFLLPIVLRREFLSEIHAMSAMKNAIAILAVFFVACGIGTFLSLVLFGSLPFAFIALEYLRLAVAGCFFLLAAYHCSRNKLYAQILIAAFCTSMIPALIGLFPSVAEMLKIFSGSRLRGFLSDPNYFASIAIIALAFFFYIALNPRHATTKRAGAMVGAVILMSAIWQSGSRSGWLGAGACLGTCTLLAIVQSQKKIKTLAAGIIFSVIIVIGGFAILSPEQKTLTFARTGYHINFSSSGLTAVNEALQTQPTRLAHGQDRLNLWKRALPFISANPFGYGPGYYKIVRIYNAVGEGQVVHSLLFEILLTAGIIGALVIIAAIVVSLYAIMRSRESLAIGIGGALAGVLMSAVFLDALSLRWLWVLFGIAFSLYQNPTLIRVRVHADTALRIDQSSE